MRFRGTCVLIVVCLGCLAATACGGESEPVDYTGTWIYTDKVTDTSCTVTVAGSADAYTARFSFETPNLERRESAAADTQAVGHCSRTPGFALFPSSLVGE